MIIPKKLALLLLLAISISGCISLTDVFFTIGDLLNLNPPAEVEVILPHSGETVKLDVTHREQHGAYQTVIAEKTDGVRSIRYEKKSGGHSGGGGGRWTLRYSDSEIEYTAKSSWGGGGGRGKKEERYDCIRGNCNFEVVAILSRYDRNGRVEVLCYSDGTYRANRFGKEQFNVFFEKEGWGAEDIEKGAVLEASADGNKWKIVVERLTLDYLYDKTGRRYNYRDRTRAINEERSLSSIREGATVRVNLGSYRADMNIIKILATSPTEKKFVAQATYPRFVEQVLIAQARKWGPGVSIYVDGRKKITIGEYRMPLLSGETGTGCPEP